MASSDLDQPALDEPALDSPRFYQWLSRHTSSGHPSGQQSSGPLTVTPLPGGRSNPTYEVSDGTRAWILRRPPLDVRWSAAHDVVREARVMAALAGSAVPVPEVIAICEETSILGCPFYLMERVDGRTLRDHDDTAGLSVSERRALSTALVETLAVLHSIEPSSVGLGEWGRPAGYLDRQLHRWKQQWDRVKTPGRRDAAEVHARLLQGIPSTTMSGFVHGDYKLDNVMVAQENPARILAVLDWEMATHGDVLADLGWLLSLWDEPGEDPNPISAGSTAHPGFLTRAEVVELYAQVRDCDVADLEWYIAFSHFKLAVILEQLHHRELQQRELQQPDLQQPELGSSAESGAKDSIGTTGSVGAMVEPLLQRALDAMP